MKYGDTLRQRSIPEWGHFNMDYDHLKDLIKQQTTAGSAKAVSIPGQGELSEKFFGDIFFRTLTAQHDRISLFVRSKSGEIDRRLEHIAQTLVQLRTRRGAPKPKDGLSARIVERYAKIDADLSKAGEEIRSLSRFQVAQRTGFRKILKKYGRWTNDVELARKFQREITSKSDSFFQLDLGALLDQYITCLADLRAIFDASTESGSTVANQPSLLPPAIADATQQASKIELDAALAITPLGPRGKKATYWIHPDHTVEVEVLLLQHMRLHNNFIQSRKNNANDSLVHRSSTNSLTKRSDCEDDYGLLILDDAEEFARKQNASTIGSMEEPAGASLSRASGTVRWMSRSYATVIVDSTSSLDALKTCTLKRKRLPGLLSADGSSTGLRRMSSDDSSLANQSLQQKLSAVQKWLEDNPDVQPIAGICSRRTWFEGLRNSERGGIWASLDQDVNMTTTARKHLREDDWASRIRADSTIFPHAVLEIRCEGVHSSALINALDKSYLVERVRGFSLEAHTVWTCCKPSTMSAPLWISLLDKDIRKLPPLAKRQPRKAYTQDSSSRASPSQRSTSVASLTDVGSSTFSAGNGESSATSAPDFVDPPPLRAFRKKPCANPNTSTEPKEQRYWNEYDNPESEEDAYYIYCDPDAESTYPGHQFVKAIATKINALFGRHTSLSNQPSVDSADTSDDESGADSPTTAAPQGYGTFASTQRAPSPSGSYFSTLFRTLRDPHHDFSCQLESQRERQSLLSELQFRQQHAEASKLRFYATCMFMALVLDAILCTMVITSKRKEKGIVDFTVLGGTVCNLLLCVVAVMTMLTRRDRLGWVHQGVVAAATAGSLVVDVLLLWWVLGNI